MRHEKEQLESGYGVIFIDTQEDGQEYAAGIKFDIEPTEEQITTCYEQAEKHLREKFPIK